ncbi:MAG: hypothetical protein HQ581_18535 [Planctomycetes bacterium]|nr:hypothetical protein [Planctomycetota bacterium]
MKNWLENQSISAYLDGELPADEHAQMDRYLASDAAARRLVEELRALGETFRAIPRQTLGPEFHRHVMRLIDQRTSATRETGPDPVPVVLPCSVRRGRLTRHVLGWSATAAAMLLMTLLAYSGRSPRSTIDSLALASPTESPDRDIEKLGDLTDGRLEKELREKKRREKRATTSFDALYFDTKIDSARGAIGQAAKPPSRPEMGGFGGGGGTVAKNLGAEGEGAANETKQADAEDRDESPIILAVCDVTSAATGKQALNRLFERRQVISGAMPAKLDDLAGRVVGYRLNRQAKAERLHRESLPGGDDRPESEFAETVVYVEATSQQIDAIIKDLKGLDNLSAERQHISLVSVGSLDETLGLRRFRRDGANLWSLEESAGGGVSTNGRKLTETGGGEQTPPGPGETLPPASPRGSDPAHGANVANGPSSGGTYGGIHAGGIAGETRPAVADPIAEPSAPMPELPTLETKPGQRASGLVAGDRPVVDAPTGSPSRVAPADEDGYRLRAYLAKSPPTATHRVLFLLRTPHAASTPAAVRMHDAQIEEPAEKSSRQ